MKSRQQDSAAQLRRQAVACLNRGEYGRASTRLLKSLEFEPGHATALTNLGAARRALGDLPGAIASYQAALEIEPDSAALGFNLANALKEAGRIDDAIARYEQVIASHPGFLRALNNLGLAYKQAGRAGQAEAAFQKALEIDPVYGAALRNLGALHEDNGDFAAARCRYMEALASDPKDGKALAKIIASRSEAPSKRHLEKAQALLDDGQIKKDARAQLNYGLGKYFDKHDQAERALPHFRAANALQPRSRPFSPDAMENRVRRTCAVFTQAFFKRFRGAGSASERPVLVVGMPRTGTTLAEQILSSHPQIAGAGELPYFGSLAFNLALNAGVSSNYPEGVAEFQRHTAEELAKAYLEVLTRVSPDADWVVDKMPQNFLYLGLVALLVPNARIVHCWRDPRDVCLSCFVEDFDAAHGFASDATQFLQYYRQYWRLMTHWRQVLPMPIFDLRYEGLVRDFEPVVRSLLDFVGCGWSDDCHRYYEQDRTVSTPSRWQVRQPIYSNSIGRWKRYVDYLGPSLEQLGMFADAGPPGIKKL